MEYNELFQDCDKILNLIIERSGVIEQSDAANVVSKTGSRLHFALQQLEDDEAIKRRNQTSAYYDIRPNGRTIHKMGGYEVYLRNKAEKDTEEKEMIKRHRQKSDLEIEELINKVADYATTKARANWSYCLSWITILIAIAALIVSIVKKQ